MGYAKSMRMNLHTDEKNRRRNSFGEEWKKTQWAAHRRGKRDGLFYCIQKLIYKMEWFERWLALAFLSTFGVDGDMLRFAYIIKFTFFLRFFYQFWFQFISVCNWFLMRFTNDFDHVGCPPDSRSDTFFQSFSWFYWINDGKSIKRGCCQPTVFSFLSLLLTRQKKLCSFTWNCFNLNAFYSEQEF